MPSLPVFSSLLTGALPIDFINTDAPGTIESLCFVNRLFVEYAATIVSFLDVCNITKHLGSLDSNIIWFPIIVSLEKVNPDENFAGEDDLVCKNNLPF